MGTRSITLIKENGETLVAIYRQFDGYISGHGRDLAEILKGRSMVNGIPASADRKTMFNGPGCMAAQIIRQLKTDEAGDVYIEFIGQDTDLVDYVYTIEVNSEGIDFKLSFTDPTVTVQRYGTEIFKGTVADFVAAVENDTIE